MERCGSKDVDASSGEEDSTKSLKEAVGTDVEKAFAMAMAASAIAQQAMETAKKAAALAALASAAAKQAEVKESQKDAAAAASGDAGDDDTSSEDEGEGMTALEYIKTYKVLPPFEVQCILEMPLERTPFTDSYAFKALSADPNATLEDIKLAFEEHEDEQDMRARFCERVRSEYEANGFVTVSYEYIARRVRNAEVNSKLWEEAFADFDDVVAGFDSELDVLEVAH